jgi:general secretion pathway protein D
VGQNVPFTTGQTQNATTGSGAVFNTVQRQDVGIKLMITPQISSDDTVRLDVNQEISDVVPASYLNASGLVTNKRSAITTVVVKDRQTMVIGGLIRDNVTSSESKVPFFGDIPLLGWLFKYKTSKIEKVNLILFITPYIIKNEEDAQDITRRKADAFEQFRDDHGIKKKKVGGLIESKKPESSPTGTPPAADSGASVTPAAGPAAQPAETGEQRSSPAEGAR